MWPRKIAMFGKGSGKLEGPRTLPQDLTKRMDTYATLMRRGDKRQFMQAAVLVLLDNLSDVPSSSRKPEDLVERAEKLYDAIEERCK